jgi:hypothetical protein
MRVAIESEEAAVRKGARRQLVVDVLPGRIAVDLDRDPMGRGRGKHAIPIRDDAAPRSVFSSSRMSEDVHVR